MSATILIVEDERAIREMLEGALRRAGFAVRTAPDAVQARRLIGREPPDLVLLDWMLPGISGLELLRRLRREEATRELPVILVTARGAEEDKLRALEEAGADDYVTKPFSPRELIARIHAVLRRSGRDARETVRLGPIEVDRAAHAARVGGCELALSPTEFRLLAFLAAHPGRVFSRAELLDRVWGREAAVEERTVDVGVRRLRKALAPFGLDGLVQTVRGAGYRCAARV
ncbi:phosphate regulon transcriptional regulator PhoB [Inmirania thermothiophila]|uniref:Phosphate regulon transcriptional regulatory protein PhoB n=1 Tax=Inmirania thermothiophila TaxID=1750597 RepID=A0A3N1Y8L0_9GAMM|nr:phosphate regulon transcriptional regulator PhoB [Inmirania thermothiophila]ROR35133.1 two-component system phosphate regulon response regulator PhoB [Inmirania thermothiophila]